MRQRHVEPTEPNNEDLRVGANQVPSTSSLIRAFAKMAWESRKIKISVVLWAIGIFFMTLSPALIKVTPELHDEYDSMVMDADNIPGYEKTASELSRAQQSLYESQVWFWRFRPEYSNIVYKKQEIVAGIESKMDVLVTQRDEKLREAKGHVGLWSDFGFMEARDRFWSAFESGKVFAQRQTFWQFFYSLMSSREEGLVGQVLHWILMTIINFTLGLLGSLFYFVFSLATMVYSYNPDPVSGTAFYVLALLGGASLVASYLFAIYAVAIGSVYVVGKVVIRNAALQYQRQQHEIRHRPHRQ